MQYGDIAVPDDPFGPLQELFKPDIIYDPARTITAPRAEHGLYILIIQHLLEIGQSFLIGTGKISLRLTTYRSPGLNRIAPLSQHADTGLHFLRGHITGGANNTYGITFCQIRRNCYHKLLCRKVHTAGLITKYPENEQSISLKLLYAESAGTAQGLWLINSLFIRGVHINNFISPCLCGFVPSWLKMYFLNHGDTGKQRYTESHSDPLCRCVSVVQFIFFSSSENAEYVVD